jgi:hypothetical protein
MYKIYADAGNFFEAAQLEVTGSNLGVASWHHPQATNRATGPMSPLPQPSGGIVMSRRHWL